MNSQNQNLPITNTPATARIQNVANGLGALLWWDLSDTRITPDNLRGILTGNGLTIAVPDIDPNSAIRRAARTWNEGRGAADKFKADVVEIPDQPDSLKVCILRRGEDGEGAGRRAKWNTVEAIVFDLKAGGRSVTSYSAQVNAFLSLADDYLKNLDHNWIRPHVIQRRLEEMKAFSLKASSGLWYVTQDRIDDLAVLQRVVAAIGNSSLNVIHINPTDSSRSSIADGASSSLKGALSELEERIETWIGSTRKIRTDAIETTMDAFQELIGRADLYAGALEVRLDDLRLRITTARDRAREIIDGNVTAHANPETKPLGKRALGVLGAIEAGFAPGQKFTTKELEELTGATSGTLQAHLRDLARAGKIGRDGRDAAGAWLWYVLREGEVAAPFQEEEGEDTDAGSVTVEGQEEPSAPQGQEIHMEESATPPALQDALQTPQDSAPARAEEDGVVVESAPLQSAPAESGEGFVYPTDDQLAGMDRNQLRQVAKAIKEATGEGIANASKAGRPELVKAITERRDAQKAA